MGGRSSGRHVAETLTKAKYKKPLNTLCNVKAVAQVDTVVDKTTEAKTEALGNSLGHNEAEGQNDTLRTTLVHEETKTLGETL